MMLASAADSAFLHRTQFAPSSGFAAAAPESRKAGGWDHAAQHPVENAEDR
jgi:hypothetical protein